MRAIIALFIINIALPHFFFALFWQCVKKVQLTKVILQTNVMGSDYGKLIA